MAQASRASPEELAGYEVIVAVCGGIAAYKTAGLVSALVQRGAGVSVALTRAAQEFVRPLTFEALSARPVHTNLWSNETASDPQHLALTEAADLIVVSPATANILAKMAHGIADDLVSTLLISAASPILAAPAMNSRMWENPAVRENVQVLRERGIKFIGPDEGWMACRTVGVGRMSEAEEILAEATALLKEISPKIRRSRQT